MAIRLSWSPSISPSSTVAGLDRICSSTVTVIRCHHFLRSMDRQFISSSNSGKAFVYGLAAHALARDQEDVQDQRSNLLMGVMMSILTGIGSGADRR